MGEGWMFGTFAVYRHLSTCKALGDRIEREDEERRQVSVAAMRFRDANLPGTKTTLSRFAGEYEIDTHNERAFSVCGQFAAAVINGRLPATGFTLAGGYGSGKTTLAVALGNTLAGCGARVRFENVPVLLSELKALLSGGGFEERIRLAVRAGVLILDDLGRERVTQFAVDEVLYPIIQERYGERRPIIVTTNYTHAQLDLRYRTGAESGPAVLERLMERCPWVEIGGESRRRPEWDF